MSCSLSSGFDSLLVIQKSSYSEDRCMSNVTDWVPFSLWVEKSFSGFIVILAQTLFLGKVSLKEMFLHFAKKSTTADSHISIFRYPSKEYPSTLKQQLNIFNDTFTYLLEICLPKDLFQQAVRGSVFPEMSRSYKPLSICIPSRNGSTQTSLQPFVSLYKCHIHMYGVSSEVLWGSQNVFVRLAEITQDLWDTHALQEQWVAAKYLMFRLLKWDFGMETSLRSIDRYFSVCLQISRSLLLVRRDLFKVANKS